MLIKTLTILTSLFAFAAATSMAQTNVSQTNEIFYGPNVVGYIKVEVKPNAFALLSNPFSTETNTLAGILPKVPVDTKVYKFDGTSFAVYTMRTNGWGVAANVSLNPGEGFFLKNASLKTNITIKFLGDVLQNTQTIPINPGFSLLGSKISQEGKIQTVLGLPAKQNDKVFQYKNNAYTVATRRTDANPWPSGEPTLAFAEGFFFFSNTKGSWERTFTIKN